MIGYENKYWWKLKQPIYAKDKKVQKVIVNNYRVYPDNTIWPICFSGGIAMSKTGSSGSESMSMSQSGLDMYHVVWDDAVPGKHAVVYTDRNYEHSILSLTPDWSTLPTVPQRCFFSIGWYEKHFAVNNGNGTTTYYPYARVWRAAYVYAPVLDGGCGVTDILIVLEHDDNIVSDVYGAVNPAGPGVYPIAQRSDQENIDHEFSFYGIYGAMTKNYGPHVPYYHVHLQDSPPFERALLKKIRYPYYVSGVDFLYSDIWRFMIPSQTPLDWYMNSDGTYYNTSGGKRDYLFYKVGNKYISCGWGNNGNAVGYEYIDDHEPDYNPNDELWIRNGPDHWEDNIPIWRTDTDQTNRFQEFSSLDAAIAYLQM